jgi:hypothetical protein
MLVHPPTAGVVAEILRPKLRPIEGTVTLAERGPDAVDAEGHNVGESIAVNIFDELRIGRDRLP